MKTLLFFCFLLFSGQLVQAQTITSYQLLPANATANTKLKLVYRVYWANCGQALNYSFTRSGNVIEVDACYYLGPGIAAGCGRSDTLQLGLLPAGTYTVVTTRHLAGTLARCGTSLPYGPTATTTIVVGSVLSTRTSAATWQLAPTVVPAATSVVTLTGMPALQQACIYDLTGREKARFDAFMLTNRHNAVQLPLPPLEPATYLLRVIDKSGGVSTQRFIRQ